jgi:glutaredoxin 3
MTRIILYTTPFCGYCNAAKRLLRGKGLDFEEVDVSFDADRRAEMIERAQGLRTVPQIFIHGRHVGGYDELAELEREGKLEAWLANASEATAPEALAEAGET